MNYLNSCICSVTSLSVTHEKQFSALLWCVLFAGFMSARDSLWYMVFIGFAVNYMIRLNINIGIVSMVKSRPPTLGNISHSSVCVQSQSSPTSDNSSTNMTTLEVHLSDEVSY